jgi:hypothetical protein
VLIHELKQSKLDLELRQAICPLTAEQNDVLGRLSANVAFLEANLDDKLRLLAAAKNAWIASERADKAPRKKKIEWHVRQHIEHKICAELFRIFRGQHHGDPSMECSVEDSC